MSSSLQMELADAKRAAEELEAVKQELAREKQKGKNFLTMLVSN